MRGANLVHFGRFLHFSQKVVGVTLIIIMIRFENDLKTHAQVDFQNESHILQYVSYYKILTFRTKYRKRWRLGFGYSKVSPSRNHALTLFRPGGDLGPQRFLSITLRAFKLIL